MALHSSQFYRDCQYHTPYAVEKGSSNRKEINKKQENYTKLFIEKEQLSWPLFVHDCGCCSAVIRTKVHIRDNSSNKIS